MLNRQWKTGLLAVAAGALLASSAAPVAAEASSCFASVVKFGNDACTTGSVGANASGHFVHVSVSSFAHWEVFDTVTNVTVGSGQIGALGLERTIFGLFGRYKLELHSFAAHGTINNT